MEVVAGRDVARFLGADLEHARKLRGTGDAIGGTNTKLDYVIIAPGNRPSVAVVTMWTTP